MKEDGKGSLKRILEQRASAKNVVAWRELSARIAGQRESNREEQTGDCAARRAASIIFGGIPAAAAARGGIGEARAIEDDSLAGAQAD